MLNPKPTHTWPQVLFWIPTGLLSELGDLSNHRMLVRHHAIKNEWFLASITDLRFSISIMPVALPGKHLCSYA